MVDPRIAVLPPLIAFKAALKETEMTESFFKPASKKKHRARHTTTKEDIKAPPSFQKENLKTPYPVIKPIEKRTNWGEGEAKLKLS